jgi:hypothetical protein
MQYDFQTGLDVSHLTRLPSSTGFPSRWRTGGMTNVSSTTFRALSLPPAPPIFPSDRSGACREPSPLCPHPSHYFRANFSRSIQPVPRPNFFRSPPSRNLPLASALRRRPRRLSPQPHHTRRHFFPILRPERRSRPRPPLFSSLRYPCLHQRARKRQLCRRLRRCPAISRRHLLHP